MNAPLPMITLRQVGKSFGAHRVLGEPGGEAAEPAPSGVRSARW